MVKRTGFHFASERFDAFQRFFQKQNDKPKFKSKKNSVQSFTSQCNYKKGKKTSTIEVAGNKIKLGRTLVKVGKTFHSSQPLVVDTIIKT